MVHSVIIGGGLAGLWLARELARKGDDVTVLEKYDYLGGRVVTSKKYGVEIGAGRIHESHRRTSALVTEYGLTRIPLSAETGWMPSGGTLTSNDFEPTWEALCDQIARLPAHTLATHTLRQLAMKILGKDADALLVRFPYRAEIDVARADITLATFRAGGDMRSKSGYYVVKEGLSALIAGLERDCKKAGVKIRLNTEVIAVDTGLVKLKGGEVQKADRIILATHATALRRIFPSPLWSKLSMAPLTRIYAAYPTKPTVWFQDIPRFVTDSPLRYVIPINPQKGTIMISYTDADDTKRWKGLKGKALQREIQKEVRTLFPDRHIPDPTWMISYEWKDGCTYWLPGDYDPLSVAKQAMNPKTGIYVCGESLSVGYQAWMEGALETAESIYKENK